MFISVKRILVAVSILGVTSAYAANFKFAFINADRVFTESKPAKSLKTALMNKFKPYQLSIQTFGQNVMNEQKQLESAIKSAKTPSEQVQVQKLQRKYQDDREILQKRMYNLQKSMQKAQETIVGGFTDKANALLKARADNEKLDLVLTNNQFVFAKVEYDMTDRLIEEINSKLNINDLVSQINAIKIDLDANPTAEK